MSLIIDLILAILHAVFEREEPHAGTTVPSGRSDKDILAERLREFQRERAKTLGQEPPPLPRTTQPKGVSGKRKTTTAPRKPALPPPPTSKTVYDRIEPVHASVQAHTSRVHGRQSALKGNRSQLHHEEPHTLSTQEAQPSGQSLAEVLASAGDAPLRHLLLAQVILGPCKSKQPFHHSPFQ